MKCPLVSHWIGLHIALFTLTSAEIRIRILQKSGTYHWHHLTFDLESQEFLSLWQDPSQGLDGLFQVQHRVFLRQRTDEVFLTSPLNDNRHRHDSSVLFTHTYTRLQLKSGMHAHPMQKISSNNNKHARAHLAERERRANSKERC